MALSLMMKKETFSLTEATVAAVGMCFFALFAHTELPLRLVSFSGLFISFYTLIYCLRNVASPASLLGLKTLSKAVAGYTAFGFALGVALGITYRWGYGLQMPTTVFGRFAVIAALIGATEEIFFRGYILGRVRGIGPFKAVTFAALCHTAYKCSLFVFHNQPVFINMSLLAGCTFVVGVAMGVLRERSGSVLSPVVAHIMFDILAYGEYTHAPWWVWS